MTAPNERTVTVTGLPHDPPAAVREALQWLGETIAAAVDSPVQVVAVDDCEPGDHTCGGGQ